MFTDTIWVNNRSLEDLKFYPSSVKGILSGLTTEWPEIYVPGFVGSVVSGERRIKPRDILIEGRVEVDTYDLLVPAIQELLSWFNAAPLELYTERDKTKVYYGRVEEQPIIAYDPELLSVNASISIKVRCADPLVYDRATTVIGFAQLPEDIPVGTAWTSGVIKLTNCANPIVTIRRSNGLVAQQFQIGDSGNSQSATGAEYITADSMRRVLTLTSAGLTAPIMNKLVDTSDFPFVISPEDGTPDNPPTIEVDNGQGEFIFRKAYL